MNLKGEEEKKRKEKEKREKGRKEKRWTLFKGTLFLSCLIGEGQRKEGSTRPMRGTSERKPVSAHFLLPTFVIKERRMGTRRQNGKNKTQKDKAGWTTGNSQWHNQLD